MRYFFQSGRLEALSYAELRSVIDAEIKTLGNDILLVESEKSLDEMKKVFKRLGGFIRFGIVYDDIDKLLAYHKAKKSVDFGVSILSQDQDAYQFVKAFSKKIKDHFVEKGVKARFILPESTELNAAQIIKNDLIKKGFEVVLMQNEDGGYTVGSTIGVQDIDDFAFRDYNKPYINKRMGMLPPKLSRIMLNLAGVTEHKTVWDPFCGSGTVLMEALMLGASVIGSDLDEEAVYGTEQNIEWMFQHYNLKDQRFATFHLDVLKPSKSIVNRVKNTKIDAIVCEPYMGPVQLRVMSVKHVNKVLNTIVPIYKNFFYIANRVRKDKMKVAIVVPSFKSDKGWISISLNQIIPVKWKIINKSLLDNQGGDLHWMRTNSIIKRNIFVLEC